MKYIIGFSGGIDSVFVAWWLKQQWNQVFLIHLKNTTDPNKCCKPPLELFKQAQQLDLPIKIVDVVKDFKKEVIDYFVQTYVKGKTPNPCIKCNRAIRWQVLEKIRNQMWFDKIATGHYARVAKIGKQPTLQQAHDLHKDQTYMLRKIIFNKTLDGKPLLDVVEFPTGEKLKKEIKEIVKKNNLPVNISSESQNICFVPDDDYPRFVHQNTNIKIPSWPIKHIQTWKYLWEHKGLIYYTIGQRRGLNLQASQPLYVIKIDTANNTLRVWEEKFLYHKAIPVVKLEFLKEVLSEEIFLSWKESFEEGEVLSGKKSGDKKGILEKTKILSNKEGLDRKENLDKKEPLGKKENLEETKILKGKETLEKTEIWGEEKSFREKEIARGKEIWGKIRYHWELLPVEQIDLESNKVIFKKPHRSPTPGQHLVLYDKDWKVLGGWEIGEV